MAGATYFVQGCPTCGRRLQIRLEYLGKVVSCRHCNGEFRANESIAKRVEMSDSTEMMLRADELLASVETRRVPR